MSCGADPGAQLGQVEPINLIVLHLALLLHSITQYLKCSI